MPAFTDLMKRTIVSCRATDQTLTDYLLGRQFCLNKVLADLTRTLHDIRVLQNDIADYDKEAGFIRKATSEECVERCEECKFIQRTRNISWHGKAT